MTPLQQPSPLNEAVWSLERTDLFDNDGHDIVIALRACVLLLAERVVMQEARIALLERAEAERAS